MSNNKSHDLLLTESLIGLRHSSTRAYAAARAPRWLRWPRCGRARERSKSSGGRKNAGTGSGQDGFRIGTVAGTHLALTSSRPGHTRVSPHSPIRKRHNGPDGTRRTHPSRRSFGTARRIRTYRPEATWAQPLGPGRAVLTRGVSRRSG